MNHHIQIEASPLDVSAQPTAGIGFLHRTTEAMDRSEVLASNIDIRLMTPDRIRSDDHAFEKRMGIPLEDVSVLEGPRLSFVGVHHQIPGLRIRLRNEGPFSPRRNSSPAQTAEVCPVHFDMDWSRCHGDRRVAYGVP